MMKVSIFGLGYVGAVSAGCFCKFGHDVIGVDPVAIKREKLAAGKGPVIEAGLDELIAAGVKDGRLRVTADAAEAVCESDLALICVGTPSRRNGSLNLDYVAKVAMEIGQALRTREEYFVVTVRSTMLPGAAEEVVIPALEQASGKKVGKDFGFCVNPEFLREGAAVTDFFEPPKTVIGAYDERSAQPVKELYSQVTAPLFVTEIPVAAMIKYVDNAFHALKVVFGNEIGSFCKALGIDSHKVMDVVCADRKLNISPVYLTPGFAFGGSCLPKDLRAVLDRARQTSLHLPMLAGVMESNDLLVRRFVDEVVTFGKRPVGVLGLSFKPGTDDLRESPIVAVIESLIGKGYDLRIFDNNVSLAALTGANKDYILNEIPHISSLLMDDAAAVADFAQIIIIANRDDAFTDILNDAARDKIVLDLVRQFSPEKPCGNPYVGISW